MRTRTEKKEDKAVHVHTPGLKKAQSCPKVGVRPCRHVKPALDDECSANGLATVRTKARQSQMRSVAASLVENSHDSAGTPDPDPCAFERGMQSQARPSVPRASILRSA